MIEIIKNKKKLYAIIIRNNFKKKGANFFTENKTSLQMGSFIYDKGKKIDPHYHKRIKRQINNHAESLFIKKGKIKVSFYYPKNQKLIAEKILKQNDVILIIGGAHGFEVLENIEMIEVKLGPYMNNNLVKLKKK